MQPGLIGQRIVPWLRLTGHRPYAQHLLCKLAGSIYNAASPGRRARGRTGSLRALLPMATTTMHDATEPYREHVIRPGTRLLDVDLPDLIHYRDLIWLLVRRDLVSLYKQTILGPAWFVLKPLLTTLAFVLVFGRIARLSTDGLPQFLFYFSGVLMWTYFSDTFSKVSNVFIANANLFRKVYFPRLILPLSILLSSLLTWLLQFFTLLGFMFWYHYHGVSISTNTMVLVTPLLVLMLAAFALGLGIFVSALTVKYRDLSFLLSFGIQLMMYGTPVIYPLSTLPEAYRWLLLLNPLTSVIETFRYAFLGAGTFSWSNLAWSAGVISLFLVWALIIFGRVEKTFVDTI